MASLEVFVHNVRSLMEQKGLKLTQVAEQVGVTKSYLSLILSNTRKNVNDDLKDKLALILGTTVADLYTPVEPGVVPAVIPSLQFTNNSSRQQILEKIDSLTFKTQANERLAPALYRGLSALGDEEISAVVKFFESTLAYLDAKQEPGQGQADPSHFQAFGIGQIKERLTFEAKVVLSHLAVIRSSCSKQFLVKILPPAIGEHLEDYLEELWKVNLVHLQYGEQTTFISCTVETVLREALTWVTATAKRNIHYRIASELAAENPDNYLTLNRIALHYSEAGDLVLARRYLVSAQEKAFTAGDYANAGMILANVAKLAQGEGDRTLQAFVAHQSGLTEFYLGNYGEALTNFKSALAYYRQSQDRYSLAEIHNAIGATYLAMYDHVRAKKHLNRGLQNLPTEVKTVLRAKLLVNLGTVYRRIKDRSRAVEYYKAAINFAAEIGDTFVRAYATMGLGSAARLDKDWPGSIKTLSDALHLLDEGSQLVPQVLTNLGISYRLAGDKNQALAALQEALDKVRLTRDSISEARIYLELSTLFLEEKEVGLAAESATKAHKLLQKSNNPKDLGDLCIILGKIALATGDLLKAREILSQGLNILNQINAEEELMDIFSSLAQVCQVEGDIKNAQFYRGSAEKLRIKLQRR